MDGKANGKGRYFAIVYPVATIHGDPKSCIYQEPHLPYRATGVAWPHSAAHWRPRHCHLELELNLITRGRGRFGLDTGEYDLGRGELIWLLPHTGHELVSASPDFDMWVVAFRPDFVERVERNAGAFCQTLSRRSPRTRLEPAALRWAEGALRSVFGDLGAARAPDPTLLGNVLARLVNEASPAPEIGDGSIHSATRRARTLLSREPSLGRFELAERLAVSESTLAHVFRRDVGVTLNEYRNRARLGRLLQLMEERPASLLDAAFAAGFGSSAQYNRCVKALTGCRPRELRNPEQRRALAGRVRDTSARSRY